jgi:hypothetical protein
MKKLFKIVLATGAVFLLLLAAGFVFFDPIIGSVMRWRVRAETGLKADIGRVEVGLLHPTLRLEDFVLYNTAEFGGEPLLVLPELYVEYDRDAARAGRLHLKTVRLNIAEVQVVQDAQGRTNIIELQEMIGALSGRNVRWTNFEFTGIDRLDVSFGRIRHTSLKPGGTTQEFNLAIQNASLSNVRTEQDLAPLVMQAVLRAGMQMLGGTSVEVGSDTPPAAPAPPQRVEP